MTRTNMLARTSISNKRKADTEAEELEGIKMWRRSGSARIAAASAAAATSNATATPLDKLITPPETIDSDAVPLVISGRDADFGTSTSIKIFYEGKNSGGGRYNWIETPPKQLNEKVVKSYNRVAIKIYKVKDGEQPTISGKTPLKIHEIELQSPVLVNALKDIVAETGMHIESSETAKFVEPFKDLFFGYDKILSLTEKTKKGSGLLKEHLELLVQVMEELFGGFKTHLQHLNASRLISFKLAWTYFPKSSLIYSGTKDCERVYRVLSTHYSCSPTLELVISAEEIAFDGEEFVWKNVCLRIKAFEGNAPINQMSCYPLHFHEDAEGVKARLAARARKALDYQDLKYCEYYGVALKKTPCGMQRHNVSGRILIDYFGYQKYEEGLQRQGNNANRPRGARPAPAVGGPDVETTYVQRLSKEKQEENRKDMLARKDDLVFFSPTLEGFALKNKIWVHFYIDDIKPVTWNDEAYSHLVYPEEQKDLVLTFVDNHQRLKDRVDDVIVGKGQGLILLLSGPPGTGKTLTAEAVADKTRRPLYYLQAEDLGMNPTILGTKIKTVFEMATEWDAVILLDEADVFMAERNPSDIARNELVSIFLRELEYFRGIIFLTTNLYSTIDVAFRSRVNIHLIFAPLPSSSRLVLWKKFLDRLPAGPGGESDGKKRAASGGVVIGEKELKQLAKWELNGREIKNAVKTVRTWCVCKGFEMNVQRLESGIKVTAPGAKKEGED